jgi:hypothetical protein
MAEKDPSDRPLKSSYTEQDVKDYRRPEGPSWGKRTAAEFDRGRPQQTDRSESGKK